MKIDDIIAKAKKQDSLHADELHALLPDSVRSEEQIAHVFDELERSDVRVDPAPPEPSAHCLLHFISSRDDRGKKIFVVEVFRDRIRGSGPDFEEARKDLIKNILEVLPRLDIASDSFERLVRTSRLREVLFTMGVSE